MTRTTTRTLGTIMARTQALVQPPLHEVVDGIHPALARICAYHFGWCDAKGKPVSGAQPGKMLRATVTLLAAEAAGGTPARTAAVPGAVAIELLHNFALLHDDVFDQDALRRGRPTVWAAFGTNSAVLAGDALSAASIRTLAAVETDTGHRALRMLLHGFVELCNGCSNELISTDLTTVEDYLRMSAAKSGALLAAAAGIGAALGSGDNALIAGLRSACLTASLAWQAANDVEDIWGDSEITGKHAFGDLRQGRLTLPVLAAVRSGTSAGEEAASLLNRMDNRSWEPERLADLIESAGGRSFAEDIAREKLAAALHSLESIDMPARSRQELGSVFRLIVTRAP
ncbi:polyprenyl synthetase family protein [Streptomyces sp. NPDC127068]|uniref:polyprenyl synthetase family protein n=1 Tax=Streptomyces sp. NPDC127068 TaxID=3347127 RepID=UPI003647D67C